MTQQRVEAARDAVEQDHRLRVRPGQLEARRVVLQRLRHDVHEERKTDASATRCCRRAQHADHLDRHLLAEELDPPPRRRVRISTSRRENARTSGSGSGSGNPAARHVRATNAFDLDAAATSSRVCRLRSPHSAIVDASSGSSPGFATRRSSIVAPRPTRYSRSASCCAAFSARIVRSVYRLLSSAGPGRFSHPCSIGWRAVRHAWKPPMRSVARCKPSAWRDTAARLDAYPSLHTRMTPRSGDCDPGDADERRPDRVATGASLRSITGQPDRATRSMCLTLKCPTRATRAVLSAVAS